MVVVKIGRVVMDADILRVNALYRVCGRNSIFGVPHSPPQRKRLECLCEERVGSQL